MTSMRMYVILDQKLASVFGFTAAELGKELGVTPRHARRLIERIRVEFGAVWELQILERPCAGGAIRYRYREHKASIFTTNARRVA